LAGAGRSIAFAGGALHATARHAHGFADTMASLLPSAGRVRFAKMKVGGKHRVEFVWKWRRHFCPVQPEPCTLRSHHAFVRPHLKTAKALGIELPVSMQLLADEVIE
jgi:hypothetical protein